MTFKRRIAMVFLMVLVVRWTTAAVVIYGPPGIAMGQGLSNAFVPYGVRSVNPPCAEGTKCWDPDFPLPATVTSAFCGATAPRYAGDTPSTVNGTCDEVAFGPQFMMATWLIDSTYTSATGTVNTNGTTTVTLHTGTNFTTGSSWNGTLIKIGVTNYTVASVTSATTLVTTATVPSASAASYSAQGGAQTISIVGCADASVVQIAADDTAVWVPTLLGGRGVFASFNPSTGAVAPLMTTSQTSPFSTGSGCPTFSKVAGTHVAYGYCGNSLHPGICQVDPFTGITTQKVDLNCVMAGHGTGCTTTPSANAANWTDAVGTGGEVECSADLSAFGYGEVCNASIGVAAEGQDLWRYTLEWQSSTNAVTVVDVKQGIIFTTAQAWSNGSQQNCGVKNQPTDVCGLNATALSGQVGACKSGLLVNCQGLHGVTSAQSETASGALQLFSNGSLEGVGTTFYQMDATAATDACPEPGGGPGNAPWPAACSVASTELAGGGHRATAGFKTCAWGTYGQETGYVDCVFNNNVNTRVLFLQRTGSAQGTSYPDDGHPGCQDMKFDGSSGKCWFTSYSPMVTTINSVATSTPAIGQATVTCSNTPCFAILETPTAVSITGSPLLSGPQGAPITYTLGSPNGAAGNTFVILTPLTNAGANAGGSAEPNTCGLPTDPGKNMVEIYDANGATLPTNPSPPYVPNAFGPFDNLWQVGHTYMDYCASNGNFYASAAVNVSTDGKWGYLSTNNLCAYGQDFSNAKCLQVGKMIEFIPATALPPGSPSVTLTLGAQNQGGVRSQ